MVFKVGSDEPFVRAHLDIDKIFKLCEKTEFHYC